MKALLRIELGKAFRSKLFWVALGIGCFLVVATFVLDYQLSQQIVSDIFPYLDHKFLDPSVDSCFRFWIVADFNQPSTYLFFMLIPLLAALPYSWSYALESASGYTRQVRTRSSQGSYLASKMIAAALSGAVAVTAPVVFSLVLTACFVPSLLPDAGSVIYFGV